MKIFNCLVYVSIDKSGNPLHTVAAQGVTENEIQLLRGIHGYDRVQKIEEVGEIDREKRLDCLMLARKYGDSVFGSDGVTLVARHLKEELHEYDAWLSETIEGEEEERQAAAAKRAALEAARATAVPVVEKPSQADTTQAMLDIVNATVGKGKEAAKKVASAEAFE